MSKLKTIDPHPPTARKIPRIREVHGDRRIDDYFWLRERGDAQVRAYLEAENAYADEALHHTQSLQETLYREMRAHVKEADSSVPFREGGYLYQSRFDEGKQYPILRRVPVGGGTEQVTVDLNELSAGRPYLALGEHAVSPDGNWLAYSLDETGYRQYSLLLKNLQTGAIGRHRRERTTSAAWALDSATLFYVVEDDANRPYRLYRHVRGDIGDELVYEERDERFSLDVVASRSGAYLFLIASSHTASEVRYLPSGDPLRPWAVICPRRNHHEYDADHAGESFYIRTNSAGCRNFRIVTAPVSNPGFENWREFVPGRPDVMIEDLDLFSGHAVLSEREAGLPHLRVISLSTGEDHRVVFDEPVYEVALSDNRMFDAHELRYRYESLVTPPSVFDYDLRERRATLRKQTEIPGYDPRGYESERTTVLAPDGVAIPVSLLARKGVRGRGPVPLHLSGYGAYGLPFPISFRADRLPLLDRGVVFAVAHVRGGGELGKAWHNAGRMEKKQNTFDDFIAVAGTLVARGETSSDRLSIEGRSAGGLLVGAVLNRRPDLFRAAIAAVPFVDVVNTMLDSTLPLTVGEFEEWGNPAQKEDYERMVAYAPYDNIAAREYPAILLKASWNDSQVPYWEAAKFAAKLRATKTGGNLVLLVTNLNAGHSGASGRFDHLRELALDQAFLLTELGVEPRADG